MSKVIRMAVLILWTAISQVIVLLMCFKLKELGVKLYPLGLLPIMWLGLQQIIIGREER